MNDDDEVGVWLLDGEGLERMLCSSVDCDVAKGTLLAVADLSGLHTVMYAYPRHKSRRGYYHILLSVELRPLDEDTPPPPPILTNILTPLPAVLNFSWVGPAAIDGISQVYPLT